MAIHISVIVQRTGKMCIVVRNLKATKMAGFKSAGMVLCASSSDHTKVEVLEPPVSSRITHWHPLNWLVSTSLMLNLQADAPVGERVGAEGIELETPLSLNQVKKQKILEKVLAKLATAADSTVGQYNGKPLTTSAGPPIVATLKGTAIC